ncbi:hypothetical protein ACWGDE_07710 [Streptomyces sp. NPDC054956]|nr:hypothetical protein [Streptomyces sp. NBC_01264]
MSRRSRVRGVIGQLEIGLEHIPQALPRDITPAQKQHTAQLKEARERQRAAGRLHHDITVQFFRGES